MLREQMAAVADQEFDLALADLAKLTPQESLIRFYTRHDQWVNEAEKAAIVKPACRNHCAYCCYYKIEAKAVEVLAIADYVHKNYSGEQLEKALAQAKKNVEEAKDLSYQEHMATNQACPFLIADSCSIYPVRPSKCRNFHASDVDRCKASYENPTDLSIANSYVAEVFIASQASTGAFEKATEVAGVDAHTYDLCSAFIEAIENPKTAKRFKDGKKTFLNAKVVELGDTKTIF